MLLSKSYDVLTSIHLKLVFDDESVKDNIISLNDVINVVYNKDGRRRTMEGYVTRICVDNICQKRSWYIIVDASTYGRNNVDRILIENIIDLDIIKKSSELITVSTPIDETKVTNIRFIDNIFQISQDNGKTWTNICSSTTTPGDSTGTVITGADGKSAYQIWLDAGNTGTEQDFLDSLKGADGTPGATSWSNIEDKPFESIDDSTLNVNVGVLKVNEVSMKSYIDGEILGGAS